MRGEFVKRVLIVAYYFPPVAASGAMRPLGFSCNLMESGWHPHVLTTTPECVYPHHQVDQKLGERVPASIEVTRVPYRDRLQQLLRCRDVLRGIIRQPRLPNESRHDPVVPSSPVVTVSHSTLKDFILDWAFAFPDRQCGWYSPAVRKLKAVSKSEYPDVVLATGGPWTNFFVGHALANYFHCPLVLDYRDPWNCNPYYSFGSKILTRKSRAAEARLCRAAVHVIANTEELRVRLVEEYGEIRGRCTWIPNGFNRDVMSLKDAPETSLAIGLTSNGYELCHFGTVYGKRTPRVLLQAMWELFQAGNLKAETIRLRFVGGWDTTDQECEHYAVLLEKQGLLRRQPPVSHSACLREMQRSSVLLVLQPDSPLQVPAKIYEYVATGRPLLLIGGEGATANLVARHALGISTPNQIDQIKRLLSDLAAGRQRLVPPDPARVNQFEYRSLTRELATVLDAAHGTK
ncbi:MAG: glycosyltransferase [Nitrospira sp.]|nr:glycosyltransferase [Nitrospira sp.]